MKLRRAEPLRSQRPHIAVQPEAAAEHDGIGRSRVTTALVERALGTRVTGRNWNTVLKLAQASSKPQ